MLVTKAQSPLALRGPQRAVSVCVGLLSRSRTLSRNTLMPRAASEKDGDDNDSSALAEEERVEAFESRLRSGKMQNAQQQQELGSSAGRPGGRAVWKKGSLFPEGWDEMDPIEKATELYLGERGILDWSTQLTIGGLVLLVAAWVGFRFIGPALGLYSLTNDISTPNL